jgi:hypothetical protein
MGANNFILAVYAVSAILAFACALLPGSGRFGRTLCVLAATALVVWPASTFLLPPWYGLGSTVVAVPPILLGYALLTLRRYFTQTTWVPRVPAATGNASTDRVVDRRSANRRPLPGEFGDVPVNQAPERHDPWEALYAASERDRLRGGQSADRPSPTRAAGYAQQAAHATTRPHPGGRATPLTRLAFDSQPAWFLENLEEVGKRDAPRDHRGGR